MGRDGKPVTPTNGSREKDNEFVGLRTSPAQGPERQPFERLYVLALYQQLLGRIPGEADYAYWVPIMTSQGRFAVALGIQQSAEYRARPVARFYNTLLNRQTPAPQDGIDFWVGTGLDILSVKAGFASSAEFFING